MIASKIISATIFAAALAAPALANSDADGEAMMTSGLIIPEMDAETDFPEEIRELLSEME